MHTALQAFQSTRASVRRARLGNSVVLRSEPRTKFQSTRASVRRARPLTGRDVREDERVFVSIHARVREARATGDG